jgi:hypothetical protein
MRIGSLQDLRPGDIMVSGMNTAPTRALVYGGQLLLAEHFRVGHFVAGHAGVISTKGGLVEAMPSGARHRRLTSKDWSPKHMYFRIPEDYPGQHVDAARSAEIMIGTPYSLLSYAYLGAYLLSRRVFVSATHLEWLAKHINRRRTHPTNQFFHPDAQRLIYVDPPKEAICSVLAEQAWTMTGMTVIRGTRPQVVTPGMLAWQLLTYPGIVLGGPGLPALVEV